MKSLYAAVFVSIVLMEWIHAAPKSFDSRKEGRAIYLKSLFTDDNIDGDYVSDDHTEDDNMEDDKVEDDKVDYDNMEDDKIYDANMEEDKIYDANMKDDKIDADYIDDNKIDELKNYKTGRGACYSNERGPCWTASDCCGDNMKCSYKVSDDSCATCDGRCVSRNGKR